MDAPPPSPPEPNFLKPSGWLSYIWVVLLGAWGGLASYLKRVREGAREKFSLIELIGEITTSGFIGLLTFYLCTYAGLPVFVTAFLIGVSGHMGSKAIEHFEDFFDGWLKRIFWGG